MDVLKNLVKRRGHRYAQKAWSWVWSKNVIMGVVKGRSHGFGQKA